MRTLPVLLVLFLLPLLASAQTPVVEVKDSGATPLLHLNEDGGFVVLGGSGSIPVEGAGTRLMWYPGKAAFRAGIVNNVQRLRKRHWLIASWIASCASGSCGYHQ